MPVGEIFLAAFVQVLFEKLASVGVSYFQKRKKGIIIESEDVLEKWQKKLRLIEAYLSDAEHQQLHNEAVKLWLQDLQDFAYDLEDFLDDFLTDARIHHSYNHHRQLNQHRSKFRCSPFIKVQNCFTNASEARKLKTAKYSSRVKQISSRLQDILSQVGALSLSQKAHSREERRLHERIGTSSLVSEPVIYGRDVVRNKIIQRLLKEDESSCENYMVVPLVGQGGIGKTTLAQSIYNDNQVNVLFDIRAWVIVSDLFDVKRITTAIINSVSPDKPVFDDINKQQEELKNLLTDKRFLIVLDDVWSDEYGPWDQLQTPFKAAAKGSRVITTTRIHKVAKNMIKSPTRCPVFTIKGLSNLDCWLLFMQHAPVDPDLYEMRDDIVPLFKGLPLAAKALGGLLRKEDKRKWLRILESNMWSEECGVLPALRLSYHHLPPHLKRIFAYCSIFPKDHMFREKEVVLMWMAEGFLREDKGSMEDIGHDYFLDLVSRCLFEQLPYRRGSFVMHDLIHDLAQWAAGDVCCTIGIRKVSGRSRHVSFTNDIEDVSLGVRATNPEKVGNLRTFAFFTKLYSCPPKQLPDFNNPQFKYLRLLSLAYMEIVELPSSVGNLKLLRYLDLSSTHVKALPGSISNLRNLQTLLLRHCESLKIVANVELLVELQHMDIEGTALQEMPMGLEKLTKLQTLNKFALKAKGGYRIRELKNLNDLQGSLIFSGLQNVVTGEDAQEARMHEKSGLDELRMYWGTSNKDINDNIESDVLHHLRPHTSIKVLILTRYRAMTFPAWLGSPSFTKMVVIKLVKCSKCICLPPLGQLPTLKELCVVQLDGIETIGPEFYGVSCSNPFPSLKILRFRGMKSWKEWNPSSVDNNCAFPCLEELSVVDCKLLQGIFPPQLPMLQILEVEECRKLAILLPSCPLLRKLMITGCEGLSSTAPVICCSESIRLVHIREFSGIEGFWVQGLQQLVVGGYEIINEEFWVQGLRRSKKLIEIIACPKLQAWPLDGYGVLGSELSKVRLVNCEELIPFLQENYLLSTVRHLFINNIYTLKYASTLIGGCTCLQVLSIEQCSSLLNVHQLPVTLRKLNIYNSKKLQSVEFEESWFSDNGGKFLLEEVTIERCKSLTSLFSKSILDVTLQQGPCELASLTRLRVSECPVVTLFPQGLQFPSLRELMLTNCTNVEVVPSYVSNFTTLTRLDFVDIKITQPSREWGLDLLASLQHLELGFLGNSVDSVECISGPELYLPSSLSRLLIRGFQNLISIFCSNLPNLTELSVNSCPKFKSIVESYLAPKLRHVRIHDCLLMDQQCITDLGGLVVIHTEFDDVVDDDDDSDDSLCSGR